MANWSSEDVMSTARTVRAHILEDVALTAGMCCHCTAKMMMTSGTLMYQLTRIPNDNGPYLNAKSDSCAKALES